MIIIAKEELFEHPPLLNAENVSSQLHQQGKLLLGIVTSIAESPSVSVSHNLTKDNSDIY